MHSDRLEQVAAPILIRGLRLIQGLGGALGTGDRAPRASGMRERAYEEQRSRVRTLALWRRRLREPSKGRQVLEGSGDALDGARPSAP